MTALLSLHPLIAPAALQTFFSISAPKSEPAAAPPPQMQHPEINPVSFLQPKDMEKINKSMPKYRDILLFSPQPPEIFHCSVFPAL